MARTGGDKTRKRILVVAERLFSSKGFDATSVDQIARTAGVNKALIYYHFKNKADLVLKMFESIIDEVSAHTEQPAELVTAGDGRDLLEKVQKEVGFLVGRQQILSLMLAEALRSNRHDDFLFRCAELIIEKEHGGPALARATGGRRRLPRSQMVHEFFTGFLPLVAFVALRDRWCAYFDYEPEQVTKEFVEAFARTHLDSQTKRR
jgi:AcrR family transcriptional regulator